MIECKKKMTRFDELNIYVIIATLCSENSLGPCQWCLELCSPTYLRTYNGRSGGSRQSSSPSGMLCFPRQWAHWSRKPPEVAHRDKAHNRQDRPFCFLSLMKDFCVPKSTVEQRLTTDWLIIVAVLQWTRGWESSQACRLDTLASVKWVWVVYSYIPKTKI